MDGEAVSLAYATTSGPDCLKEVISKYGLRLKVYQAIKRALTTTEVICYFSLTYLPVIKVDCVYHVFRVKNWK